MNPTTDNPTTNEGHKDMSDNTTTAVTVFGPNLNAKHAAQGYNHIHAAGCGHAKQYRYLGESYAWTIDVASVKDVVFEIYGDIMSDTYDESEYDAHWEEYNDLYVAPCLKSLPYTTDNQPTTNDTKTKDTDTMITTTPTATDRVTEPVTVEVEARSLRKDDEFKHGAKGTVRVTATKLGQKNVKVTYAYLKGTDIVEANTYLPALELVTVTRNVETEASERARRFALTSTKVMDEVNLRRADAVTAKITALNTESGWLARDLVDLGVELAKAQAQDDEYIRMGSALEHWSTKLERDLTGEEIAYIAFKYLTHRMMGFLSQSPAGGWSGGSLSSSNMVEVAKEHATREIFGDSYGSLFAHLRYTLKEYPIAAETIATFDFDNRD